MKWEFCEYCIINGKCENQDRGKGCKAAKALEYYNNVHINCNYPNKVSQLKSYIKRLTEENEKLKKQLEIAVNVLKEYADCKNWSNEYDLESASFEALYWANKWKDEFGYKLAFEVLKKIEELDK